MDIPWKRIPFSDYERHMSDSSVGQLSALSAIIRQQYAAYNPSLLVVFGICTGNGLEYVDLQKFISIVKESGNDGAVVSAVLQRSNGESFVSKTNIKSREPLSGFHVAIQSEDLQATLARNQFELLLSKKYSLPGKKEFLRFDFWMK